jgi:hypothetical protein
MLLINFEIINFVIYNIILDPKRKCIWRNLLCPGGRNAPFHTKIINLTLLTKIKQKILTHFNQDAPAA